MTRRRERKAMGRWEHETRRWATGAARELVLSLCDGEQLPVRPYGVGVVLGPGEQPWAECPVRFLQETPMVPRVVDSSAWPPVRPWLVTSERVVGRLGDGRLYGYRWENMVGCRVVLEDNQELVAIDLHSGSTLSWTGPGVAPMAAAAVYALYGLGALVDHPGLCSLRAHCVRAAAGT